MRTLAAIFLLCAAALAQTYEIAGTVVHSDGRPAKRVRVAVALEAARENETAVMSSENGAFRFAGLPAGKFHLTAEPPAGGAQSYGQRRLSQGFGTAVVTGTGQHTDNLVFRLIPRVALHGRVTDANGDPAEGVLVQILFSTLLRGKRTVFYAGYRNTDDRGEYRFGSLSDGTYYVVATGRPWYAGRRSGSTPLNGIAYVPTYYPNAHDARAATPLELKPGDDVTADFVMAQTEGVTLTMFLKPAPTDSIQVNVMLEGPGGSHLFERVESMYGQTQSLTGMLPGRYTLQAKSSGRGQTYGTQTVVVGSVDTSAQIALAEPPLINGKVKMEDGSPFPEGAYVELENEVERIHMRRAVSADGSFQFDTLPPGSYRPLLGTTSKMIPLRAVKADGAIARQDMISIARSTELELTASLTGGQIRGFVYRDGQPAEGVLALLAPRKDSVNPLDYHAFQTDADGSFEWTALAPGDYVIIVKEDWFNLEYANPEAIRPLMKNGRAIHIDSAEVQNLKIELK